MSNSIPDQYRDYFANFKNSEDGSVSVSAQGGGHESIRLLKRLRTPCRWIKEEAEAINEPELKLPAGGPHTFSVCIMMEFLADPCFVDTLAALSDQNGIGDVPIGQLLDAWLEFVGKFWELLDAILAAFDRVPDLKAYAGDNIAKSNKSSLFKFDPMADQAGELIGRAVGDLDKEKFKDSYLGTNRRYLDIAERAGHPL